MEKKSFVFFSDGYTGHVAIFHLQHLLVADNSICVIKI